MWLEDMLTLDTLWTDAMQRVQYAPRAVWVAPELCGPVSRQHSGAVHRCAGEQTLRQQASQLSVRSVTSRPKGRMYELSKTTMSLT